MRIVVAGSGYVGLVSGAGFAEIGNHVVCADIDSAKIERLKAGEIPIFEPGLESLIERNVDQGRLTFTDDLEGAVKDTQAVFIAVGTPMRQDGAANLMAVDAVAQTVADHAERECVLVAKSTVPVGTNARIRRLIEGAKVRVHAVSNPEFLKEGAAVGDFMRPDRIVVGVEEGDTFARDLMKRLYHPLCLDRDRMVWMDPASAELTKYVANTMLAMRISFMNEIAALCEQVGADIHKVRYGVGSDDRIGAKFLYAGPGYGGSCLDGRETVLVERDGAHASSTLALRRLDALFEAEAGELTDEPRTQVVQPQGLRVLAWTPDGSELRDVQALTRRPYEGEVREVRTKMGRRLRCTPDHPFVARRGPSGPEEVVLAEQLTEEHWLPAAVDRLPHEAAPVETLDLLELLERTDVAPAEVICCLDEADRAQLSALGSTEVADRIAPLGHPRGRDRAYDIVRSGTCRVPEAEAIGLRLEHATLGTARNGTYVPRRLRLDERFWEVAGLYLAEGHITADGRRRRIYWSFHPRDEGELVDTVSRYWRDLGVKHDVREGTTAMHVSLSSRLLAAVWTDVLGLGADCYSHRIPELAWAQPREHKRALLRGMWLGDGSWSYVAGGPSVVLEYGTVSRPLADGLLRLLAEQGLVARWKTGRVAKSTRDTHWFVLSGAEQIERARFLVDERSARKIQRSIDAQAKRIAPTGYRLDPRGRTAWVRVTRIERASHQGHVYSLEVPGPETVVTTGGLVTHNCFPKDVKALVHTARDHGLELELAATTDRVNVRQKGLLFRKLKKHFDDDLRGKRIAVWGIAFKPRTDDLREAPALTLIDALLADGATVVAHDPEAVPHARERYGDRVTFVEDAYDAVDGAHALVLVTEWRQYHSPDFEGLKQRMARPLVLDGRNVWSDYGLRALGFTYEGVGVKGS